MRDAELMDPLLEKFNRLEREALQRECDHKRSVDITCMSDPIPRRVCQRCGWVWLAK